MAANRENRLAHLQRLLRLYPRVAIAFSGGVDSTLLLRVASDTLGPTKVTALHAVSCLVPEQDTIKAERLVNGRDGIGCSYQAVRVYPLRWRDFAANSEQRCYFCKKRLYRILQNELQQHASPPPLLDGTNSDDLLAHRPGLSAIYELSVNTPLAQARLTKDDIRELARKMGLSNWNQPSNSCLATRIPLHHKITKPLLQRIAKAEMFLHNKGFAGCRVKPLAETATIHVLSDEKRQGFAEQQWSEITGYFKKLGFSTVLWEKRGC
jgi:pyridinium-3,5-biscarboxylic acid mononucleotide sulfurtransferase